MSIRFTDIDRLAVNTIRTLSIDAIEKSKSGHPGLPMGAAPMAYMLWRYHLNTAPNTPHWPNRDRFVLSAGHGSMLQYALLHLAGFGVSLNDIKNFRQKGSITPGHPELHITPGVETTTGPLGQGFANAVGMAITERMLAHRFNKSKFKLVDHYTYVLTGDGCLMEGIAYEAASLAGHLKLGKLICLYDSNNISLDGPTSLTFTEDTKKRFTACGWQVLTVKKGDTDLASINKALEAAKACTDKPSLIIVKTTIGYGSPNKAGSSSAHGSPLGADEAKKAKAQLGFDPEQSFMVSQEVYDHFAKKAAEGKKASEAWQKLLERYKETYPELAVAWTEAQTLALPKDWDTLIPSFKTGEAIATRKAGNIVMNALAKKVDYLAGGDADLSCSTLTGLDKAGDFNGTDGSGRNIRFGVREHAMGAIANGMACHGGVRPFTATFFSFVDYMRPAIRLAALSKLPSIFVFTHDSVAVGEDGPTHQPIEQLASIRGIPGLITLRPADATETAEAWRFAMQYTEGPVVLVLSRQNITTFERTATPAAEGLSKGAYSVREVKKPDCIILATGAEVQPSIVAAELLQKEGKNIRVVSMPSWELFEKQSASYKEAILPAALKKRVSVEAASSFGWCRYTGAEGISIAIDTFGFSAPGDTVLAHFGFTAEKIAERIRSYLK